MIDIIILAIFTFGFLRGLRRGFILQLFHLVSFIVAFIVAVIYYDDLASHLTLWIPYPELSTDANWGVFIESLPLENAFYNAIAFAILFFATKIVLHIIASMLDFIAYLPILSSINSLLGAVLGFVEVYFVLFLVMYISALLPIDPMQNFLEGSFIAKLMIEQTPFISDYIKSLWFEYVVGWLPFD